MGKKHRTEQNHRQKKILEEQELEKQNAIKAGEALNKYWEQEFLRTGQPYTTNEHGTIVPDRLRKGFENHNKTLGVEVSKDNDELLRIMKLGSRKQTDVVIGDSIEDTNVYQKQLDNVFEDFEKQAIIWDKVTPHETFKGKDLDNVVLPTKKLKALTINEKTIKYTYCVPSNVSLKDLTWKQRLKLLFNIKVNVTVNIYLYDGKIQLTILKLEE